MRRGLISAGLLGAALVLGSNLSTIGPAAAATIEYTLSGAGPLEIQGTNVNGDFTFSWIGDTSNVSTSGGESRIFALPGTVAVVPASYTGSFLSPTQIVLDFTNGLAFGFQDVCVPQGQSGCFVAAFQLTDPALTSIALDQDFTVTVPASDVSLPYAMPLTNSGLFSGFVQIEGLTSSVTFSADITATPLPSSWTMLIAGLVGLGFFAYWGSKKSTPTLAAV